MRAFIPVLVFAVAVGALSGCSAGTLPGDAPAATSGSGSSSTSSADAESGANSTSKSGAGATAGTECSIAGKVLTTFVTGTTSSPYQKGSDCYFGVGPNGTLSGATLAQQYGDVIVVQYGTSGADSQMAAANQAYGGGKGIQQLSGVGTEAHYWGGVSDESSPQVWARTSGAWCVIQTHLNSATEVGLTAPGGSAVIAKADMPGLGAKFGSVCTALFGG